MRVLHCNTRTDVDVGVVLPGRDDATMHLRLVERLADTIRTA